MADSALSGLQVGDELGDARLIGDETEFTAEGADREGCSEHWMTAGDDVGALAEAEP
jgi:hypothetical protein